MRLPLGAYSGGLLGTTRRRRWQPAFTDLMWDTEGERTVKMNLRILAQSAGEPASHRNRGQVGTVSRVEIMFSVGSFSVELPEYLFKFFSSGHVQRRGLNLILWKRYSLPRLQSCWHW